MHACSPVHTHSAPAHPQRPCNQCPLLCTCVRPRSLAECVDFVVCLGGDGVILHASGLFDDNVPPVSV